MTEHLKAWQCTKALAVLSLRLTTKPAFQKYPDLITHIQESALAAPNILSRRLMPPTDAEELWIDFTFGEAGMEIQRLKTLLHIAHDLDLVGPEDGSRLLDSIELAHRLIVGLQRAQNKHPIDDATPKPLRPSGSRGPSRRPPASGGGSRGGDPWDTRS